MILPPDEAYKAIGIAECARPSTRSAKQPRARAQPSATERGPVESQKGQGRSPWIKLSIEGTPYPPRCPGEPKGRKTAKRSTGQDPTFKIRMGAAQPLRNSSREVSPILISVIIGSPYRPLPNARSTVRQRSSFHSSFNAFIFVTSEMFLKGKRDAVIWLTSSLSIPGKRL